MKVCVVAPLPPPQGGISMWTERIQDEAKRHSGIKILIVDISSRWRSVYQNEYWRRIIGGGLQLIRDLWRVWMMLSRHRPRVIHLCTSAQWALIRDILVLWLAKHFSINTFYHLHFGRFQVIEQARNWEWCLLSKTIVLADTVIVLDGRTREAIQTVFPLKTVLQLPNFVNLAEREQVRGLPSVFPRHPNLLRLTYIGWVIPTKGVLELIQAAVALADRIPFELEIIGPSDPVYLKQILETGALLGERLWIRGELLHEQAMVALRDTDILVLPSYTEGFPNIVIEAMSFGKPVIGTDVGAIREILEEGEPTPCGIVVPPKDVKALEDALGRLLNDPQMRELMGRNARVKVEKKYQSRAVFQELLRIWGCGALEWKCA
jgi:glycosyltransferase involved in cell wall biosynthesis